MGKAVGKLLTVQTFMRKNFKYTWYLCYCSSLMYVFSILHTWEIKVEWPTIVQTETTEGEREIVKQEDTKYQQKLYHIITVGTVQ